MDKRQRLVNLLALGCFVATTSHLGATYDSLVGFERPIHLSVLTVLLVAASCFAIARHSSAAPASPGFSAVPQEPTSPAVPVNTSAQRCDWARKLPAARLLLAGAKHVRRSRVAQAIGRIPLPEGRVLLLAPILACRAVIFWHITRYPHCAWGSVQFFLPLFVFLSDVGFPACRPRRLSLPFRKHDPGKEPKQMQGDGRQDRMHHAVKPLALAFVWGLAATQTTSFWQNDAGSICPSGSMIGPMASASQLISLVLDAAVLAMLSRARMDSTGGRLGEGTSSTNGISSCWGLLATACSIAGALLFVGGSMFLKLSGDPLRGSMLSRTEIPALVLDSVTVATWLLSAVHLLATFGPATVALTIVGLGSYVRQLILISSEQSAIQPAWTAAAVSTIALLACTGLLLRWDRDTQLSHLSSAPADALAHRALGAGYLTVVAIVLVSFLSAQLSRDAVLRGLTPLTTVISEASAESMRWQGRAAGSRTLEEAVEAYKQRHGIPPPPNFDKWYEFARARNSPIIDEFAQINADLLPFWGVEPAVIRRQTSQMLDDASISIGGLKIHKGEIELSAHTPGTHRWMMEGIVNMIKPFAKWIPDMDLAFNLDDECRVTVPYEAHGALLDAAAKARARLAGTGTNHLVAKFEPGGGPWPEPEKDTTGSPMFVERHSVPVYRDSVAPTCPPGSLARTWRWWNRRELCTRCAAPHTTLTPEGSIVSNWTLSGDVCHQPDLAYLDGFLLSPAIMRSSKALVPVFSQAKVPGFSDILFPSPWNYMGKAPYDDDDEAADVQWSHKRNGVFWRGSATDGFADHGAWHSFLRARFVHGANAMKSLLSAQKSQAAADERLSVNVSFVGDFVRCDECQAEADHFYGPAGPTSSGSVPFVDHWRYRHLVDLDGAGYSGRFLPFLESRSLVYRAAVFRTWYEERVHPWRHYVPVDLRLGRWLWNAVGFFAGPGGPGPRLGEAIALEGRDWARKALRPADMEVYMFRLLLEWGRLVDDQREQMGYGGAPAS